MIGLMGSETPEFHAFLHALDYTGKSLGREQFGPKLPLARKFPGKRKYWALAGKMPGNPVWKEIDRKYNKLPG